MTTLAEGRKMLEKQYDPKNCPDRDYGERMLAQIQAITTGKNPYYAYYERVPLSERVLYGWLENHPQGMEIALAQWIATGASETWGRSHTMH